MHDLIRNLQRSVGDVRAEWDLPRLGDPLVQGCSLYHDYIGFLTTITPRRRS
jgi:hypothetical protein